MNKTKNLIFAAAVGVFSIRGYEGATMDEIALNAGVAKGTLYYHFKCKEDIFKYIVYEGMKLIEDELETALQNEDNPIQKLRIIFKTQLKLVNRKKDFFKVIIRELWGKEIRQFELRIIINKYILQIEEYIKEAMELGIIKQGNSSLMAYSCLGNFCSSAIYEICFGKEDIEEVTDNVMQFILYGLIKS